MDLSALVAKAANDFSLYGNDKPFSQKTLAALRAALQQEDARKALVDVVFWELQHADPKQLRLNFAHWWADHYGHLTWNSSLGCYELSEPDALTWWSFMTHEELMAALDYYMQAYPHEFIKPLDPNFDRSLAVGLRAHFGAKSNLSPNTAKLTVNKLITQAAMLTENFRWMDPDLFFKFPPDFQRELLRKHNGGTLQILVRYAVKEDWINTFDKFQEMMIARYTDDDLMEVLLDLIREGGPLADRSSTASQIYRRLQASLQARGIEPHLAEIQSEDLMGHTPWIAAIVNGITYVPNKESSRNLQFSRVPGRIVEVWFRVLAPGDTTPGGIVTTDFWQV